MHAPSAPPLPPLPAAALPPAERLLAAARLVRLEDVGREEADAALLAAVDDGGVDTAAGAAGASVSAAVAQAQGRRPSRRRRQRPAAPPPPPPRRARPRGVAAASGRSAPAPRSARRRLSRLNPSSSHRLRHHRRFCRLRSRKPAAVAAAVAPTRQPGKSWRHWMSAACNALAGGGGAAAARPRRGGGAAAASAAARAATTAAGSRSVVSYSGPATSAPPLPQPSATKAQHSASRSVLLAVEHRRRSVVNDAEPRAERPRAAAVIGVVRRRRRPQPRGCARCPARAAARRSRRRQARRDREVGGQFSRHVGRRHGRGRAGALRFSHLWRRDGPATRLADGARRERGSPGATDDVRLADPGRHKFLATRV